MDEFERHEALRQHLAELASDTADTAEHYAEFIENIEGDQHAARRKNVAAWEREVAGAERRNAGRLRDGDLHNLEPLPESPSRASRR